MARPDLSIVIPVYNEAGRLANNLSTLLRFLSPQKFSWEVVLCDDGSQDQTLAIARELASFEQRLRILNFSPNHGKGFAVRQGVLVAQGEWVLFMDADLATSLLEITKFWQHRELASVLIGSRYLRKNSIIQLQPWYRRLASRFGNLVIQLVLLPGLSDTQCGFKMFSRQPATDIFTRSIQNGWSFDVEILAIAKHLGLSSVELPVEWSDQPNSRISIVSDSLRLLVDLYKIKSYLSRLPR